MSGERPCPSCDGPVPSLTGYPDWCEDCGWNLEPQSPLTSGHGRFGTFVERFAQRAPRRVTGSRVLAYVIAVLVLALDVALLAGGVAAVIVELGNLISMLIGATMVSLGLIMRPRVPQRPEGVVVAHAPTLHALVARIAAAEGVEPPQGIVITADWNAAWAEAGLRRRRWLVLGLPLWTALEPQERVALIAHEIGHEKAGDLTRTLIVGSAVNALDVLSGAMVAPEDERTSVDWLARRLAWLVSRPVDAVLWLQARLLFRDLQHAEYVADERAADVAGAPAVIALHERLLLQSTVELTVQQHALHGRGDDVLEQVRSALAAVPERERERRRRIARLERTRLTDTHPPLGRRIARLEDHARDAGTVTLDGWTSQRIDDELAPLVPAVGRALVEGYQS